MTKLVYLSDTYQFEHSTKVVDVKDDVVLLEETIFHPQGGGQPSDIGIIKSKSSEFLVKHASMTKDGLVEHSGEFKGEKFQKGEEVTLIVDKSTRIANAKCHSGGHLLDTCVRRIYPKWESIKGYHFPRGPYVEFKMNGEMLHENDDLVKKVQEQVDQMIKENPNVIIKFVEYDKVKDILGYTPSYLPKDKPARIVTYGEVSHPCSGTHVRTMGEIQHLLVRKFKKKGQIVRISYETK